MKFRPRFLVLASLLVFTGLFFSPLRSAEALDRVASKTVFGDVTVPEGETTGEVSTVFGDVAVDGWVDGDVNSVFGEVTVDGRIGGTVSSAFGDVAVRAPVRGDVEAGFGDVVLAAPVRGKVDVGFGNVEQETGGVAYGGLAAKHGDVEGRGALSGSTWQTPGSTPGDENAEAGPDVSGGGSMLVYLIGWSLGTLGFIACAVLVAVLLPRPLYAITRNAGASPGWSFVWGLVSIPVAVVLGVLLVVSVIGIPVMLLAVPAYLALLFFGALAVSYALGRRILFAVGGHRGGDALAAATGALAVAAVSLLPVFGGLLTFGVAMVGAGAAISALFSRGWSRRPAYESYEAYLQDRQQRGRRGG